MVNNFCTSLVSLNQCLREGRNLKIKSFETILNSKKNIVPTYTTEDQINIDKYIIQSIDEDHPAKYTKRIE